MSDRSQQAERARSPRDRSRSPPRHRETEEEEEEGYKEEEESPPQLPAQASALEQLLADGDVNLETTDEEPEAAADVELAAGRDEAGADVELAAGRDEAGADVELAAGRAEAGADVELAAGGDEIGAGGHDVDVVLDELSAAGGRGFAGGYEAWTCADCGERNSTSNCLSCGQAVQLWIREPKLPKLATSAKSTTTDKAAPAGNLAYKAWPKKPPAKATVTPIAVAMPMPKQISWADSSEQWGDDRSSWAGASQRANSQQAQAEPQAQAAQEAQNLHELWLADSDHCWKTLGRQESTFLVGDHYDSIVVSWDDEVAATAQDAKQAALDVSEGNEDKAYFLGQLVGRYWMLESGLVGHSSAPTFLLEGSRLPTAEKLSGFDTEKHPCIMLIYEKNHFGSAWWFCRPNFASPQAFQTKYLLKVVQGRKPSWDNSDTSWLSILLFPEFQKPDGSTPHIPLRLYPYEEFLI